MKLDKSIAWSFAILVLMAALYRIIPSRPLGFAPQIAIALFSGSVVANKKYSFLMPLASMFLSDLLYQALYAAGLSSIQGFYDGQIANYLLFAGLTIIGFGINKNNVFNIAGGSIAGVLIYFIASNFLVWLGGGLDIAGQPYPKTFAGLSACFIAAEPFLKGSFFATMLFSTIFFGSYHLVNKYTAKQAVVS
ncbi:MAG: hypothetical protein RL172_2609 [Bacteroidota bacterium]|jgi:hypothetical protein